MRSQSEELDRALDQTTAEELGKGWVVGPDTLDQVPEGAIVARRFGIKQGGKK